MRRRGFTLVELLIVLAILALIAMITIPTISSVKRSAAQKNDEALAGSIQVAVSDWMYTDFSSDTTNRDRLYSNTAAMAGVTNKYVGRWTEMMYCYLYAGTEQLPGTEFMDINSIRHAVITALKSSSNIDVEVRDGEQFIPGPTLGAEYGFKYYYKLGKVTIEKTDSTVSAAGTDEVYNYYVWLDQSGGQVDSTVIAKKQKNNASIPLNLTDDLYGLRFDTGFAVGECRFVVEGNGQSLTVSGNAGTPAVFLPGSYDVSLYYKGAYVKTVRVNIATGGELFVGVDLK